MNVFRWLSCGPLALALLAGEGAAAGTGEAAAAPQIDQAQLIADLRTLSDDAMEGRHHGSPGGARARAYVAGRFEALGLKPEQRRFRFTPREGDEGEGVNVWASIAGKSAPGKWIVVTAHYDHVGIKKGAIHNGADDNASGVAVLLALAAELRRAPPEHSVMLVALDAEEPMPGMFGAKAFLAAPPVPIGDILLNVNMDMVGRQDGGALWAAGTGPNPALRTLLEPLAAAAPVRLRLGHDGHGSEGEDWTQLSDQMAFHARGIPFVYFGVEDHDDYHRPGDDADKIDPAFFGGVARTIVAAVRRLDAAPDVLAEARRTGPRR